MSTASSERRTQADRVAESERALLTAAIELIGEQGYARTTAAQIGERAGYSRSHVRARYGSMDALVTELLRGQHPVRRLLGWGEATLGIDQVLARVDLTRAALAEDPALVRVLNVLKFESATQLEVLIKGVAEWSFHPHQVAAALSAGQRDGSVRADLDPDREARRFMAYGSGIAFRWMMHRDNQKFDTELREWSEESRRNWQPHTPAPRPRTDE